MIDLWWRLADGTADLRWRFEQWMADERHAPRGVAAVRIGTGLAVLGLLLANFSTRDLWVGPASIWAEPSRSASNFPELVLLQNASGDVLAVLYAVTMLAALSFTIGWHTKAANVVALVGFIAVVGQNPVVGVQADSLLRLALLWLLLTRCGDRWSIDARRRATAEAEAGGGDPDVVPEWLTNLLHNAGVVALAVQTVLAYSAAGLAKVAQPEWQDGTALYYSLQLPETRPFPGVSDLLSSSDLVLAVLTYAVLLVQLFFAPLLLSRASRHAVIAAAALVSVLFGLLFAAPWSQLAVASMTVLFVSDDVWQRLEDRVYGVVDSVADRWAPRWYGAVDELLARTREVVSAVERSAPSTRRGWSAPLLRRSASRTR